MSNKRMSSFEIFLKRLLVYTFAMLCLSLNAQKGDSLYIQERLKSHLLNSKNDLADFYEELIQHEADLSINQRKEYFRKGLLRALDKKFDLEVCNYSQSLATIYENIGKTDTDLDSVIYFNTITLEGADRLDSNLFKGKAYNSLGTAFLLKNEISETLDAYHKSYSTR